MMNTAPKMLALASVFIDGWKICAMFGRSCYVPAYRAGTVDFAAGSCAKGRCDAPELDAAPPRN
jgi:hypothetical protein